MSFNIGLSMLIDMTVLLWSRARHGLRCVFGQNLETPKLESEAPHNFLGTGITGDTDLPKWPHLLW